LSGRWTRPIAALTLVGDRRRVAARVTYLFPHPRYLLPFSSGRHLGPTWSTVGRFPWLAMAWITIFEIVCVRRIFSSGRARRDSGLPSCVTLKPHSRPADRGDLPMISRLGSRFPEGCDRPAAAPPWFSGFGLTPRSDRGSGGGLQIVSSRLGFVGLRRLATPQNAAFWRGTRGAASPLQFFWRFRLPQLHCRKALFAGPLWKMALGARRVIGGWFVAEFVRSGLFRLGLYDHCLAGAPDLQDRNPPVLGDSRACRLIGLSLSGWAGVWWQRLAAALATSRWGASEGRGNRVSFSGGANRTEGSVARGFEARN